MPRDDAKDIRNPIREFFVAKPGWKFVSSDYVNLEAQLLGFETQDPELCEVFAKGLNLHDVNTKSMFGNDPSDPQWSIKRKVAKIAFFACICYGGSPSAIYRKIMAEIPSLQMTLTEFAESIKTWMDNHPAYRTWEQAVRFMAREQRKVQTSFGRIRIFLGNDADIEKEALNHMIQSSGASLVNRATIRIWKELRARNMRAQLVLQVHDQLVIEAPDEEVEDVKELIVRELQRPFMFRGVERSIPCDCTVGDDFGKV
jgi:DNA polymerase-1